MIFAVLFFRNFGTVLAGHSTSSISAVRILFIRLCPSLSNLSHWLFACSFRWLSPTILWCCFCVNSDGLVPPNLIGVTCLFYCSGVCQIMSLFLELFLTHCSVFSWRQSPDVFSAVLLIFKFLCVILRLLMFLDFCWKIWRKNLWFFYLSFCSFSLIFCFLFVVALYLPSWFHKLKILVSMAPVDMSVGTIDMAYTVDIPRCWCDCIGVM